MRKWFFSPIDYLVNDQVNSKSTMTSKTLSKTSRISTAVSSKKHFLDSRLVPKAKIVQTLDTLIDSMDLDERKDILWPKNVFNPAFQRLYQCISFRAMDPTIDTLPPVSSDVENLLQVPTEFKPSLIKAEMELSKQFDLRAPKVKAVKGRVRKTKYAKTDVADGDVSTAKEGGSQLDVEFSFLDADDVAVDDHEEVITPSPKVPMEKVKEIEESLDMLFD